MKSSEKLYHKRLKRLEDAIHLKKPDRVPFLPIMHFYPATYVGMSGEEAFYDYEKWFNANKKTILDFEPDLYLPPAQSVYPGRSLEILDCKQIKWPGHGVSSKSTYQFVEGEYMKAGEYEAFLSDPTDFLLRTYMPRIFGALEPLKMLPDLMPLCIQGYKGSIFCAALANPEIVKAFEALYKAGIESMKYLAMNQQFVKEMKELGFPLLAATSVYAPFDYIGDMLRGMKGLMLDLFRQPENLLEAMDRILPILLKASVATAKKSGCPRVFIPLHRGSDGFLSLEHFERFYWPGIKKIIFGLIEEGLTPCPFFEGDYTSRLEYLKELPKGKILAFFDSTDLFKAKEAIGDTLCIAANMPLSLLSSGTPGEVRDYTKKFIDELGGDGGFVMSANTVLDDADPELVRVWSNFTREYGAY